MGSQLCVMDGPVPHNLISLISWYIVKEVQFFLSLLMHKIISKIINTFMVC